MTNFNTSSPTTQAVAFITIASALAISITLQKSKKTMTAKAAAAAAAAASRDPNLPARFLVGTFENSRSQSLFTINLPPKDESFPPKAMFVLAHGVGEHCCRPGYVSLYESLSDAGVDVYGLDHHGHGRSSGLPRGYAEKFDDYVADILAYVRKCQGKYIDNGDACPPLFLFGQSMGGLVSVMAALQLGSDQVGGLVLTSPALGVDMDMVMKVQKMFAPAIDKFLPKARIVDAVRPEDLSRNPQAVQAYIDDPLIDKGKVVARTAIGMDKTFDVVRGRRREITCPILLLHGTDDRVTSSNASLEFFRNVGSSKKRYLRLRGYYHELFEEPETIELMSSIVEFVSTGGRKFADVDGEEKEGLVNVEFNAKHPDQQ